MTDRKSRVNEDPNFLFTLRIPVRTEESNPVSMVVIHAFDGGFQAPNHNRIDVEVRMNGKVIFPRGATWCGIPGCIDGNEAKELVLATVAMKPGDTDSDYFKDYAQDQLDFANTYGEELGMIRECRYCDENGNVRTSRKRLLDKLVKKGGV
jgi:hypothetical protein